MRSWILLGACGLLACGGKVAGGSQGSLSPVDAGVTGLTDGGVPISDTGGRVVAVDAPVSVVDTGSGVPTPDATFFDGGETDGVVVDDGGVTVDATTSSCEMVSPFTPITWAPPTPLHQAVCTPAQTLAYTNALNGMGPYTSGNAACDKCLQTGETSPAHGPIVTVTQGGMTYPAELNIGGCLAHFDMMLGPTGCGATYNNYTDCTQSECYSCSDIDNPQPGGPTDTCYAAVVEPGQPCASAQLSAACIGEASQDAGPASACVDFTMFNTFFDLWCGK